MKNSLALAAALATGLTLTSALAGCGAHPTGVSASRLRTRAPQPMRPYGAMPQPGAPLSPQAASPQALQQLLGLVQRADQATQGFRATVDTYDHGSSGTESDEIDVAFQKPSTLHLNMVKATGQAQGASIVWTGGDQIQIKLKVGFVPITTSLAITDGRLKSKNGWTIKQTESNAMFKVLFDPQAQIQIVGQQPSADGRMLTMLQVHSAFSPPPTDHEVIGVDPQSGIPMMRMMYQGQTLLYRLTIKNMRPGAPGSAALAI